MINTTVHNILCAALLVFSWATVQGQRVVEKNITISHQEVDLLLQPASGKAQKTIKINNGSYVADLKGVPTYSENIPLPNFAKVTATLVNPQYVRLSQPPVVFEEFELREINVTSHVMQDKTTWTCGISFVPFRKVGNGIEILKSATLRLDIRSGSQPRNLKNGYKTESILATGEIYKLAINESGVYRIDRSFLTNTLNLSSNVSLDDISLWGHHGGPLPEPIQELRIDDLEQIPSRVTNQDLIFYAEGPDRNYTYNPNRETFDYLSNVYADQAFIYLKVGDERKAISDQPSLNAGSYTSSSYDEIQRHEENTINLLGQFASAQGSGQQWFGEIFSNEREQDFSDAFDFSGVLPNEPTIISAVFAGRSRELSNVVMQVDDMTFTERISSVRTGDIESRYARLANFQETIQVDKIRPQISIEYPSNGQNSEGWLDYIQVQFSKELTYNSNPIIIRDKASIRNDISGYSIATGEQQAMQIWDITDPFQVKNQSFTTTSSGASFYYASEELRSFVCFNPDRIDASPTFIEQVENQNLHAINRTDMVIIYHPDFEAAAERLAEHRRQHDGLTILTINIFQVFNEFSAGKQDPTAIRDFAKMIYDRDPAFNYLLLLGDGSYDYRGITPGIDYQNFVPTYETRESLNPLNAFPSDDYYTLLSDNEGSTLKGAVDIAVGRIPAKTSAEADVIVEKIISYDTNPDRFGDWKLRVAFTADDEDSNTHLNDADGIARDVALNHEVYNLEKIYFDAFQQESTPGGARYPLAKQKLNNEIFKGLLLLNYLGHGGSKGWSQERVLQVEDIIKWDNYSKLPFIITATCSFTGFDDPGIVTAGEESILNPSGGAVGLYSTVRSVYASQNERLTSNVFDTIFTKVNGEYMRVGEVLRRSKNASSSDTININARKFLLIGDPSMKLALPEYDVVTTSINGMALSSERIDTLRALEKVELTGQVTDGRGNVMTSFDGTIVVTCFDKTTTLQTLGNDRGSPKREFAVQRNVLFKGEATVANGIFAISFVIPKDINYAFGQGKLSYYAFSTDEDEAIGYTDQFIIGGTSDQAVADDQGPRLKLFMNDEAFVTGGITGKDPVLLVKLSDDIGINFTGNSIGHDITAIIDDNSQQTIILNDFYSADADDFTKGSVAYPLKDLEPGLHTIRVKAFDVANNSAEALIEFLVLDGDSDGIRNVYNYPNPFTTDTEFMFEHTFVNQAISIQVDIYTLSGKLVKTIQDQTIATGYRQNGIRWNGRDDFGSKLAKGIYLYKIKVSADNSDTKAESDFQKLVILN